MRGGACGIAMSSLTNACKGGGPRSGAATVFVVVGEEAVDGLNVGKLAGGVVDELGCGSVGGLLAGGLGSEVMGCDVVVCARSMAEYAAK